MRRQWPKHLQRAVNLGMARHAPGGLPSYALLTDVVPSTCPSIITVAETLVYGHALLFPSSISLGQPRHRLVSDL